ncbi:MAG: hypothetical protein ACK5LZ_07065 [Anaerorhabdus sp.]
MSKDHTKELDELLKRLEEAENEFKDRVQEIEKIQESVKAEIIVDESEGSDE